MISRESAAAERGILLDKALKKAENILRQNQINPSEFEGLYDPALLERHRLEVEGAFARFEAQRAREGNNEGKVFGTILEAILLEQGEMAEWLGSNAYTQKTADFDDLNGTDIIVEYETEGAYAHLGLGVDVTSSSDLGGKLKRVQEDVDSHNLASIYYFKSDTMGFKGKKDFVPRVVIGVEAATVYGLMELWLREDADSLAKHPIQATVLKEVELQLQAILRCLPATAIEGRQAAERDLVLIQGIIKEKNKAGLGEALESDEVYLAIQSFARALRPSP